MPDADRIAARLDALWEIARGPGGGADRPAYSHAEAQAMLAVAGWAGEQGLEPAVDAHGNLWALPAGSDGPIVTAGSHVDTVPDGGRYDGALGTVLGLELARDLGTAAAAGGARAGVLVCAAEEAPRFGAGTIGSRLLVGTLDEDDLMRITDSAGVTAAEAQAGYLAALDGVPRIVPPTDRLRAHAEVHVAQRRELRELGIVTRVASPRRFELRIDGEAGHSGEVSMEARRDALAAAAEVILAIEAAARAEPPETVATVGRIAVSPGAVSVIPGQARLAIDVRGISSESLAHLDTAIQERVAEICARRGVGHELTMTRAGEPVALDPRLAATALEAAAKLGIPARETWSGAGHDAQHLNALAPCLLTFVPLHGGESHTPQEGAAIDEILQAGHLVAAVLGQAALDTKREL
ncbi:MAG TPA: hydantoinase/carbamoylase family amidase [Solirubrobacteraceae bacterium]|nr:hydantoinase/carbamoylase family amidase [Solirubrobacteraceae bacterium]